MTDEILEKARQLRAAGASIEQVKQYLQSKGYEVGEPEQPVARPAVPGVRPDATMALQRERENPTGDIEALFAPGQGKTLTDEVAPAIAAHLMNTAQGVPGVRAVQAGVGSLASKFTDNPMSYGESLSTLDEMTEGVPSDLRVTQQLIGGGPAMRLGAGMLKAGAKYAPVAGAVVRELPFVRSIDRGVRSGRRVLKSLPKGKAEPVQSVGKVADDAPPTLEGLIRNPMDEMAEVQRAATLEQRLAQAAQKAPHKPRHRTKAQFDYFADRMAQKAAEREASALEPSLEDLLAASLEHIKKGGTLRQASDAASKARPR